VIVKSAMKMGNDGHEVSNHVLSEMIRWSGEAKPGVNMGLL